MHLIYLDESGNTGNNLADPQQPVFVLGALIVHEHKWQPVEAELERALERHVPSPRPQDFEMHAGDLRQGTGCFKGIPVHTRVSLRDEWLRIAGAHQLRFTYRAITKNRYERWMKEAFGTNISVNPHLAAFPLVAQVTNSFLKTAGPEALGIFISDDNREVVSDIERFLKLLRATPGALRLDRIIEKGFFIDSHKSLLLQLADLCTLFARKDEERKIGLPPKKNRRYWDCPAPAPHSSWRGSFSRCHPMAPRGPKIKGAARSPGGTRVAFGAATLVATHHTTDR